MIHRKEASMITLQGNVTITEAIRFGSEKLAETLLENHKYQFVLQHDKEIQTQAYKRELSGSIITICASDDSGFMYALLDLAKEIAHNKDLDLLSSQKNVSPYLEYRGIKFNIPLDARTPSYSDASDSAAENIVHMWDVEFWSCFLDNMALNRFNLLTLWSLSPFPSLVSIPEYPEVALTDVKRSTRPIKATTEGPGMFAPDMVEGLVSVKKISMDEKIAFWKWVMEYAHNRCIKVMLYTWNLFVYGTENNPYGITEDQNNPQTQDYIYCGTKALLKTYPLLAGIGVTTGENMRRDETDTLFIRNTYGRAVEEMMIEEPMRKCFFIHRMQYTNYEKIASRYEEFPRDFTISFKYSQAHMYSNTKPTFIEPFLKEKKKDVKIWLEVRNDDYYMFPWGQPLFAKEYLSNMPVDTMYGFNFGPDGYTWGRDYLSKTQDTKEKLVIERMWYMFMIWGHFAYNYDLPEEYFIDEIALRFALSDGRSFYEMWSAASSIISMVNCTHWHDYDFQWYPEGCCMYDQDVDKLVFADIEEFMVCPAVPGNEYESIAAYCERMIRGEKNEKISPMEQVKKIRDSASNVLHILNTKFQLEHSHLHVSEMEQTKQDIKMQAFLGYYYANKIEAAIHLTLYRRCGMNQDRLRAVELLEEAVDYWYQYALLVDKSYKAQALARQGGNIVDVMRFYTLTKLDVQKAAEV